MSRTPTRPVQVRLPAEVDEFLITLAAERNASKTQIVVEALECLRRQVLATRLEAGYRELAGEHAREPAGEHAQLVQAGLTATLPTIRD